MEYVWFAVIDVVLAFSIVVTVVLYYKRLTAGIQPKRASQTGADEWEQLARSQRKEIKQAEDECIQLRATAVQLRSDLQKAYAVIKDKELVAGEVNPVPTKDTDHLRQISIGIDVLAMEQQKFRKGFDNWVRVNFGNNSGGYQDMTDDEASLREEAATLMRRYGMSYEDAMTRAKLAATYKGNGMGGAA